MKHMKDYVGGEYECLELQNSFSNRNISDEFVVKSLYFRELTFSDFQCEQNIAYKYLKTEISSLAPFFGQFCRKF